MLTRQSIIRFLRKAGDGKKNISKFNKFFKNKNDFIAKDEVKIFFEELFPQKNYYELLVGKS